MIKIIHLLRRSYRLQALFLNTIHKNDVKTLQSIERLRNKLTVKIYTFIIH